jgi:hypothetical protein
MNWYKKKAYPIDGMFGEVLIYYIHCMHTIPMREYLEKISDPRGLKMVTLATNFNEKLTFYLHELPFTDTDFIRASMRTFLNTCYQILIDNNLHTNKLPEIEFLRHLRNAASHGGKFKLEKDEPRKPANWRKIEITKALQGKELLGFISPGDVILLIQDIDSKLGNEWETLESIVN